MSGEDAPRPCPEDLIVLEIKTNKQTKPALGWAFRNRCALRRAIQAALRLHGNATSSRVVGGVHAAQLRSGKAVVQEGRG